MALYVETSCVLTSDGRGVPDQGGTQKGKKSINHRGRLEGGLFVWAGWNRWKHWTKRLVEREGREKLLVWGSARAGALLINSSPRGQKPGDRLSRKFQEGGGGRTAETMLGHLRATRGQV